MPQRILYERAIERLTGLTMNELRTTPLDIQRRSLEKKFGRCMRFTRNFPMIGRGTVLRDYTLSHDEVEAQLTEALR